MGRASRAVRTQAIVPWSFPKTKLTIGNKYLSLNEPMKFLRWIWEGLTALWHLAFPPDELPDDRA